MSAVGDVLRVVLALSAVCALAWAAIWLMRRLQARTGDPSASGGELRFVRALPLGPRERLVEVVWRGEALLLGVTAGGITLVRGQGGGPAAPSPPQARADPS